MYLILYVVLIAIMSYCLMYLVSNDKSKGDQSGQPDKKLLNEHLYRYLLQHYIKL